MSDLAANHRLARMRTPLHARAGALSCAIAVAAAVMLAPTSASGDVFGPIALVSDGARGGAEPAQADYAHDPALSGDGRYEAFDGSVGGVPGVWLRDLATGALEQVAGGDAELPSISEDGRYVSFTTNEGRSLAQASDGSAHEPKREAVNVYVRDMSKQATEPGAFTLASAVDGSEEALSYEGDSAALGASAVGRTALSADGREVAFVTTAVSNLVRYPKLETEERERGETPKPHTPALQVVVRYLDTRETKLVSLCYRNCEASAAPAVSGSEGDKAYGAVYPGASSSVSPAPPYGEYGASPPVGASISADGSTVAWMGEDIGEQAPMLAQETRSPHYTEPLWRRIAPGSETPTERITGGSDPENPACGASGESTLPESASPSDPCQGPFLTPEGVNPSGIMAAEGGGLGDFVPRLSADGYTVAFISQAPPVTLGQDFGRASTGQPADVYLADMHPGLTRDQALIPLTELAGGEGASIAATAPIFDFAISPDGSQVAFSTRRTQFPLGSPALVSAPAGEPGLDELFDADLGDETLTRVTHGYEQIDEAGEHAHEPPKSAGEDPYLQPGDGALSPSFSTGGELLAFSSTASNLDYGDGNAPPAGPLDGSDAFLVGRVTFALQPTAQYISPTPLTATEPLWQLWVTAVSRSDGSVLLYARVPGAGALRALARSAVLLHAVSSSAARRQAPSRRGHTRRARRPPRGPSRSRARVATRTVADATKLARSASGELVALVLRLAKPYAPLAAKRGGLSANVSVTFGAPDARTLRQSIAVSFRRTVRARRRPRKAQRKHRARKGRR